MVSINKLLTEDFVFSAIGWFSEFRSSGAKLENLDAENPFSASLSVHDIGRVVCRKTGLDKVWHSIKSTGAINIFMVYQFFG